MTSLSISDDCELVEIRQAVSLRPKACFARLRERLVFNLEQPLPVEEHGKQAFLEHDAEHIPSVAVDLVLDAVRARRQAFWSYRSPDAVLHLVQYDIVFQSVGT